MKGAVENKANIRIVGDVDKDFYGNIVNTNQFRTVTIDDKCNVQEEMNLKINDIPDGCRLKDGSVVMSNYESLRDNKPVNVQFVINNKQYNISYIGTFAIKVRDDGTVEKLVSSKLYELKENDIDILEKYRGSNVVYNIEESDGK